MQKLWPIERAAIFLTITTIKLVLTLGEFAILVVSFFYAWFSVLIVGGGLVLARKTFLLSIPALIDLAVPLTLFIDGIIVSFDMIEAFCTTVHNMIGTLIGETDVSFTPVMPFTVDAFKADLELIARECAPIDSVSAIAAQWVPEVVDHALCPVFRALWPLPHGLAAKLYAPFDGWVSDPTPFPNGGNCARPQAETHGVLCAALAVGYAVLEVVLPSVFVGLLIVSSGAELAGIIWWILMLFAATVDECACILLNLVRALRDALAVCTGSCERFI